MTRRQQRQRAYKHSLYPATMTLNTPPNVKVGDRLNIVMAGDIYGAEYIVQPGGIGVKVPMTREYAHVVEHPRVVNNLQEVEALGTDKLKSWRFYIPVINYVQITVRAKNLKSALRQARRRLYQRKPAGPFEIGNIEIADNLRVFQTYSIYRGAAGKDDICVGNHEHVKMGSGRIVVPDSYLESQGTEEGITL